MPYRCVTGRCSNVPDASKNIRLHKFPKDNESEKKRRRLWANFVRTKRWSPTANSRLCSEHFRAEDFENRFISIPGTPFIPNTALKVDAVPSIHKNQDEEPREQGNNINASSVSSCSTRGHRQVRILCSFLLNSICFQLTILLLLYM